MSEETLFGFEDERTAREAATILRELADGFEDGTTLSFGDETVVAAPSTMEVEMEVERDDPADGPAEMEIEIEFEWFVEGAEDESEAGDGGKEGEGDPAGADSEGKEGEEEVEEPAQDEKSEEEEIEGPAQDEKSEEEVEEPVQDEESEEAENEESEEAGEEAEGVDEPEGEAAEWTADSEANAESAVGTVPLDDPGEEASTDPVEAPEVTSLARFQVYRGRDGQWRWRLVHRNGNVIATGGQGYDSRRDARKGLRSVVANAPAAAVDDVDG